MHSAFPPVPSTTVTTPRTTTAPSYRRSTLSATFAFPTAEYGAACFAGEESGHFYTRISNPTLALLEARMATLENGEAAVAFSSGMGAIAATFWTLLRPGDEVIVSQTLYGCTFALLHHGIAEFGIKVRHVDLTDLDALHAALSPATRMIYCETPANPNLQLVDIAAVATLAHQQPNVIVVVDNTYCTPYLQRPLELGADVVVHSATKYLSGHGDITAGIAVSDHALAQRIRLQGLKDLTGAVMSPQDASLLMRGLKTLALRMDRHCSNAQAVAEALQAHPAVERVTYPGLRLHFPVRTGGAADADARRDDCLRAQRWDRDRPALHERTQAVQPRGQPGRCRVSGPTPGEHDPLHLHPRGAGSPRDERGVGASVGRAGGHRRPAGGCAAGFDQVSAGCAACDTEWSSMR